MKRILYVLLGLILVIGLAGLIIWNLPKTSIENKSSDITIASAELSKIYTEDENAGNTRFIDKIVAVEGTIEDISTDENGATVFLLQGVDMTSGVLCTLDASQTAKANTKKAGDTVKLKGKCTGMLMDVVLNKCFLLE